MPRQASFKQGAKPTHKISAAGRDRPLPHETAQKIASYIRRHSTDLEVFARHEVYEHTVDRINDIQNGLNDLRPLIEANLKGKDQPQWSGLPQDSSPSAFFYGLLFGLLLGLLGWFFFA